eukprot:5930331-Heterocapsa_arctica.AAC.1
MCLLLSIAINSLVSNLFCEAGNFGNVPGNFSVARHISSIMGRVQVEELSLEVHARCSNCPMVFLT